MTLRIRWPLAIFTSAPLPVVFATLCALLIKPVWLGLTIGVTVAFVMTTISVRKVRRRSLTVTDAGLHVQRDTYAVTARWQDVTGVTRRRHQLLLPIEELTLSDSEVVERSSTGKVARAPVRPGNPATRRVFVSLYDKNWRTGPIGIHLRAHSLDLG